MSDPATRRALALEQPPERMIDKAISEAMRSPCRSQRGVVIFDEGSVARGHNRRVDPPCDGSAECKATCRVTAIHAEQAALLKAGLMAKGRDMLHVKVVDGQLVPSGGPSCVACSKLIVAAGIRYMWLFQADGWRRYEAPEFHRLSVAHSLARSADPPPAPPPCVWQDISSAPKDGTPVILYWREELGDDVVDIWACGYWREFGDGSKGWIGESFHSSQPKTWTRLIGELPTHWMPIILPTAPGEECTNGQ